jgi:hypothetical protein
MDPACLEFDHIDTDGYLGKHGNMSRLGRHQAMLEWSKGEWVCVMCHRMRTTMRRAMATSETHMIDDVMDDMRTNLTA